MSLLGTGVLSSTVGLCMYDERTQDAARRMAEEQAALEAKVFHTRSRLPPQHTTVPQPFSLSSAEAQVFGGAASSQLFISL